MRFFCYFCMILISTFLAGCRDYSSKLSAHEQQVNGSSTCSIKSTSLNWSAITDKVPVYRHFDINLKKGSTEILLIDPSVAVLEIFDLSKKKKIFSKSLQHWILSQEVIENMNGIHFYSYDSIFVSFENEYWIIDTAKVLVKVPYPQNASYNHHRLKFYNLDHFPIRYDEISRKVISETYSPQISVKSSSFYKVPVAAEFDPVKGYQLLPIVHPTVYHDDYYGFAFQVFHTLSGEESLFSFPVDPNVYVLDRSSRTVDVHFVKSRFQEGDPFPFKKKYHEDTERKMDHLVSQPFYLNVMADEEREQYYRFFLKGKKPDETTGKLNNWQDKELILMIMDDHWKILNEMELGSNVYNYSKSFVGEEGVYLYRHDGWTIVECL